VNTVGLIDIVGFIEFPPHPELSHCTLCFPLIRISWFNKHNHFLHPLPEKSHFGKFFSRDMFNTLKASSNLTVLICHLFLSVHSLNLTLTCFSSGLGKVWTLFLFAQMWAQPAPLPNRALSPFPLLGPRRVTHGKAQGPGPLLRSHSRFSVLCGLALFPQLWWHLVVLWSSGGWREHSLTSCQVARS